MSNITTLKQNISESDSLKLVIDALGEVATMKLKATRKSIQQNTVFFDEIGAVYRAVQIMAEKRRLLLHEASPKNGRNISLLITSNAAFHGGLDSELTSYFIQAVGKYSTDIVVIGRSGEKYLRALGFTHPYQTIIFDGDFPKTQEILDLTSNIKDYSKILVYHSKFVTVLDQQVEVSDLSATAEGDNKDAPQINYLIEPELPKMLSFFEGQILSSLLESVFLESELAKTAARMVSMDTAGLHAEKILDQEKQVLLRARKNLQNIRILETFVQIKNIVKEDYV